MMVDWVTAKVPIDHFPAINGGKVFRLKPNGEVDWSVDSRLCVEGSFSDNITVRKAEGNVPLEFSGNPAKFLQGHNLFGCCNVPMLVFYAMVQICWRLDLKPSCQNMHDWQKGNFSVSRIDVNDMVAFQSRAEVRAVLRALSESASVKYRGRGVMDHGTLYFGKVEKGQQRASWSLKLYCKADELKVHDLPDDFEIADQSFVNDVWARSKLPAPFQSFRRKELIEWVENKMRVELTFGRKELYNHNLTDAFKWDENFCYEMFHLYLSKLNIGETVAVTVEEEKKLSRALRRTFSDWKEGKDLRQVLPKTTFYKHRAEIQKIMSVDIAVLQPKSAQVIPLRRKIVLDFNSAALPEHLITDAYLVRKSPFWDFQADELYRRAS
jgi:II/X family phage/plasmid replication protein